MACLKGEAVSYLDELLVGYRQGLIHGPSLPRPAIHGDVMPCRGLLAQSSATRL
jgi:hypothetical protein